MTKVRRSVGVAICAILGILLPAVFGLVTGIPEPLIHDEFSYLLAADTFAQGRLTNPSPPVPAAFETEHVLVDPTYQSKYPPAQGLALALGQRIFGHPIWGVWISCGLFSGALCWMLQAWTSRHWALAVTLLTIATLGISTYWAQSYWGGMVAGAGGALLFGGFKRTIRRPRTSSTVVMCLGLVLLANSRPFEGLLLSIPAVLILTAWLFKSRGHSSSVKWRRVVLPAALVGCMGVAWVGTYNAAVTGSAVRMPYTVHQAQYFHQGIFVFSPLRPPERTPPARIAAFYTNWVWTPAHGFDAIKKVAANALVRLPLSAGIALGVMPPTGELRPYRGVLLWVVVLLCVTVPLSGRGIVRAILSAVVIEWAAWMYLPFYPYSLAPPMALAALVVLERGVAGFRWKHFIAVTATIVAIGLGAVALWYPHYSAPLVPLVLAGFGACLQRASRRSLAMPGPSVAMLAAALLGVQILTLAAVYTRTVVAEHGGPELSPAAIHRSLAARGGQHLVFVRYGEDYPSHLEWVYNAADLDRSSVIFAHDLGDRRNADVIAAYRHRAIWHLSVEPSCVNLQPYAQAASR